MKYYIYHEHRAPYIVQFENELQTVSLLSALGSHLCITSLSQLMRL